MITSRKNKIAIVVAIIVLFVIAVSTMGVSYAVWTSPDGTIGGGQSTASPSVTPDNSYVWAKYFKGNVITVGEQEYAELTTFYTDDAGLNLSDVFIPDKIAIEGKDYQVYRITNGIFADATLKNLPVMVHIPSSVREIDDAAFAGLENLETVYFANENVCTCTLGEFAFAGCSNLKNIYNIKGGTVTAKATAFIGTPIKLNTDGTIPFSTN